MTSLCRHCRASMPHLFLDLGHAPPSNAFLAPEDLNAPEMTFPLRLRVCDACHLVQTEDYANAHLLFDKDYAYYSSTSENWLDHASQYCNDVLWRFGLGKNSYVIEIASNDGYLLRNFLAAGVPCLGIEPTRSTASAAIALGVPTQCEFFGEDLGRSLADQGRQADLIVGNNVYAHVPDINDFTLGIAAALKPEGVVTLEFQHLMRLVEQCQFDTVYHEHFSYLSLISVRRIFEYAGLRIFDVEELSTHGGSLRIYGCHKTAGHTTRLSVEEVIVEEQARGMQGFAFYEGFQVRAESVKNGLLSFLLDAKRDGRSVAGYAASAKGNTLLNFAGIKPDLLPFICDAAPSKQGKWTPGTHIPILPPKELTRRRPDFILILSWNIVSEIKSQLVHLSQAGSRFVTAVPEINIG